MIKISFYREPFGVLTCHSVRPPLSASQRYCHGHIAARDCSPSPLLVLAVVAFGVYHDPKHVWIYASFVVLMLLPGILKIFFICGKYYLEGIPCRRRTRGDYIDNFELRLFTLSRGALGFSVTLLGTLRDDGFSLFAGTATALLFFLSRVTDDPSPNQVAWIMANPIAILVASIDVWLLRFDIAALDRILPRVPFLQSSGSLAEQLFDPDLEDVSLRNGLRAANLLLPRISAAYFLPLAAFVQAFGAVAFALPLSDLGGRQSGFDERGADILRIVVATYGILSSLVGTTRLLRKPTFKFTVRGHDGHHQVTTGALPGGSRERRLLYDRWPIGVDWLATRVALEIKSVEEFAFLETQQIAQVQGSLKRREGQLYMGLGEFLRKKINERREHR